MSRLALVWATAFLTGCASAAPPAGAAPAPPDPTPVPAAEAAGPTLGTPPSPVPALPAPAAPDPADEAVYRVGSGDVLEIVVFSNDDLNRTAMVQNNGAIAFPLLGEVTVAGLTVAEIKGRLTNLLGEKYLVDPQVDIRVHEYNSQFVSVLGEVNSPGRKPLKGGTRLIDVLLEAGGLRATASGEVVVARSAGFDDGQTTRRARLSRTGFSPVDQAVLEMRLRTGDIVTVLPKYYVTVQGEVARPNRYLIDGELTVTGAISLAGGLTRYGSNNVEVLRRSGPGIRETTKLELDLKAVREGQQPDLVLQPDDIVTVPRRFF